MQPQPTPRNVDPGQALLDDIKLGTPLPPNVSPEVAFTAVMCTLSQHVTGGEALHVFDALPREIHSLVARCLIHRGERSEGFGYDELVRRVGKHLDVSFDDAENVTLAVFRAVTKRLPEHELQKVSTQLPQELRMLWTPPRPMPPDPQRT
jgi:uncharacterized protein (DUF2267 family)